MSLIDRLLTGKKRADPLGDAAADPSVDGDMEAVQRMYGLEAGASAPSVSPAPAQDPAPPGQTAAPRPAPEAASPGRRPVPTPTPAPTPTATTADDGSLDSPLRELFTEHSTLDPQLETLLAKVEKLDARDLANELREFARFIGAERSPDAEG